MERYTVKIQREWEEPYQDYNKQPAYREASSNVLTLDVPSDCVNELIRDILKRIDSTKDCPAAPYTTEAG